MRGRSLSELRQEVLEIKDRHPHLSLDGAYVAWFLRAFIVDDEDQAIDALKGASRDKGVDAVYLDHESRIAFVIQGKYRQGSKPPSEKRSDVIALADTGRSLLVEDSGAFRLLLADADSLVR